VELRELFTAEALADTKTFTFDMPDKLVVLRYVLFFGTDAQEINSRVMQTQRHPRSSDRRNAKILLPWIFFIMNQSLFIL
jgi:hypothetical protein